MPESMLNAATRVVESRKTGALEREAFWRQLFHSPEPHMPEPPNPNLDSDVADLVEVHQQSFPKFEEEMLLRIRPLREQWDAMGPGLLRSTLQAMNSDCESVQSQILLVQPIQGGGGLVLQDAVTFEAVLTNEQPQLPEVLRLTWLLATQVLNHSLPKAPQATDILAAVLSIGEDFGLTTNTPALLEDAAQYWAVVDSVI